MVLVQAKKCRQEGQIVTICISWKLTDCSREDQMDFEFWLIDYVLIFLKKVVFPFLSQLKSFWSRCAVVKDFL